MTWRTSSWSNFSGNCVEAASWRKAAASNGTNCVEAGSGPAVVGVRDSQDPAGPVLEFGAGTWQRFTASLR